MNRRDFFKTMFATPLMGQLLLASNKNNGDLALYLISDEPHWFLPILLDEVANYSLISGRNFTFLNPHPQEHGLKRTLIEKGWSYVQKPTRADLALSFSHLQDRALPSFTLVKEGRIWDIRARKLQTLWKEMNENHKPSSCLTVASLKNRKSDRAAGEYLLIYRDGRRIEKVSLNENFSASFRSNRGKIKISTKDGKAWVSESSCRHKICLYSFPISLAGERIICAPNHFLLELQGHSLDTVIG